jgi:tRNA dimethylallyltransferase
VTHNTELNHPILSASTPEIFQFLKKVDPIQAGRLSPGDRRKIQGKVELYLRTGKIASEIFQEQKQNGLDSRWETLVFWVWSERDALNKRLDKRVDKMVELGVEDECRELYKVAQRTGIPVTSGVFQAIGIFKMNKIIIFRISRIYSYCHCRGKK